MRYLGLAIALSLVACGHTKETPKEKARPSWSMNADSMLKAISRQSVASPTMPPEGSFRVISVDGTGGRVQFEVYVGRTECVGCQSLIDSLKVDVARDSGLRVKVLQDTVVQDSARVWPLVIITTQHGTSILQGGGDLLWATKNLEQH